MSEPDKNPEELRAAVLAQELRALNSKLKRRLREQSDIGDLTWSQTEVLVRLDREGPATVTALAKAEGMRPQSMGATIASLEAAGFITGAPDPSDKRQTILSLTKACRDWIEAGRAARQDWLFRAISTELTVQEQEQLATGIALIKRLVNS